MNRAEMAVLMKGIAPVMREVITRTVQPLVDRLVAIEGREPEKGDKGDPGKHGCNLQDFAARVLEDDRTIEFSFRSGEYEHIATMKWPTVIDRGVYKEGRVYDAGDGVTWGGSWWIAQKETSAKPDSPDSGFRLAVKKGRDGKDAK